MEIKGIKIKFDFTFFAVIGFLALIDTQGTAMLSLIACVLHECGHLSAMSLCGCFPDKITFYGGGISISSNLSVLSVGKQTFVLFAGCLANFLTAAVCILFSENETTCIFSAVNILICAFNLLPIGYFDGARLIDIFLGVLFSYGTAVRIKRIAGITLSAVLIAAVCVYNCLSGAGISLSLGFTVLYLIAAQFIS